MPGRGVKASIGGLEREFPPRRGLQAAARASGWLGDSSEAERAALASGTHLPQQVPNPSCRERSRMLVAPQATAVRMCRSETALQTQMIVNTEMWAAPKRGLKQRLSTRAPPMHNACCPWVAVR